MWSGTSTPASSVTGGRITLIDNTAPTPTRSQSPAASTSGLEPSSSKREILRKAIAERKYKRWSAAGGGGRSSEESEAEEAARAEGVVVGRDEHGGDGAGDIPARKKKKKKDEIAVIDVLYENQRGAFVCGIPLFSSKSLLNFDPAPWQNGLFHDSPVSIVDAQVPDPSWVWDWKSWYVDMTADVDEGGWAYSFSFSPAFAWHGTHVWFHSFVRRRRWLRKRVKLPKELATAELYGGTSTVDAHGLNDDYFTIHSRVGKDARTRRKKRSVLESADWGGDEESDEEVEVKDVATLMKVVRRARLDREKIEAIMRFVEDGGDEVVYLADKLPELMRMMIFQASRRQLLAHLVSYTTQYEAGKAPTITIRPSDSDTEMQTKTDTIVEGKSPSQDTPAARARKIEALRKAAEAADQEVKKMEFWSDVKDVARTGESMGADLEEQGWNDLGISGPSLGNEKMFGGPAPDKGKGKGKEVVR